MAYSDARVIGEVTEITGHATIIRGDGTQEPVLLGTEVYEGDIVETEGAGAVNITFIDESSFAVSSDARVAIDEFIFDPVSEAGTQDFSVLRGVFMYTSGLIGRENPDSVEIDTPVGSIGIRGTIIGGNIDPAGESHITVIEGAIVVRNDAGERLLSTQYDTVRLSSMDRAPSNVETLSVDKVAQTYGAVKDVSAGLFSSFNDQMQEQGPSNNLDQSSTDQASDVQGDDVPSADEINAAPESGNQTGAENTTPEGKADLKMLNPESKESLRDDSRQDIRANDRGSDREDGRNESTRGGEDTRFIRQTNDGLKDISLQISANSVDENSGDGTVIGRVQPSQNLNFSPVYSLVVNPGNAFAIDPDTGVVTLNGTLGSYEDMAQTYRDITVQATNPATGNSRVETIRITVNDVNEAPTAINVASHGVDEAASINDSVATLTTIDPDAGDTHSYQIIGGDPDGIFQIVGNEIRIADNTNLDYETTPSYTLTIRTTDSGNLTYDQDIVIDIANVNEVATLKLALEDLFSVTDTKGLIPLGIDGAMLGRIVVDDPDGQTLNGSDFTILGNTAGVVVPLSTFFEITGDSANGMYIGLKDGYSVINQGGVYTVTDGTNSYILGNENNFTFNIAGDGGTHNLSFGFGAPSSSGPIRLGGESDDTFIVNDDNFQLIRGGGGNDLLILNGVGNATTPDVFDFRSTESNLSGNSADLKSIEQIHLNGSSNDITNTLKMNVVDIVDLLKTSDTGKLIFSTDSDSIYGTNSGNHKVEFYFGGSQISLTDSGIDLDGDNNPDFVASGTTDIGGQTYNVYTHDLGQVLIDSDIVGAANGGMA